MIKELAKIALMYYFASSKDALTKKGLSTTEIALRGRNVWAESLHLGL